MSRSAVRSLVIPGAMVLGAFLAAAPMRAQQTASLDSPPATTPHAESLLARRVTVHMTNAALRQVVDALARSAQVRILYRADVMDAAKPAVSLDAANIALGVALERVLAGTSMKAFPVTNDAITIRPDVAADSVGTLMGRVVDAKTKQPVRDVAILLDGVSRAVTGPTGSFDLLNVPVGAHRLTVRRLGYLKQVVSVTVAVETLAPIQVLLEPSVNALDQVVVTGTIAQTSVREISNAITVVTAKDLQDKGITHIDQLFRGDVPGLFMPEVGLTARPNAGLVVKHGSVQMYTRGSTVMPDQTTPTIKTYVDGVPMSDPDYLNQIDVSSIDHIEIVTGPQASTLYGSGSLAGVMQIFTKHGVPGSRPQLTASIQYGTIENNFSSSLAPRHNDNIQLNDAQGNFSYNAGASYQYDGQWTPGAYTRTFGGYGAGRRQAGPLAVDFTARASKSVIGGAADNGGSLSQAMSQAMADGQTRYLRRTVIPTLATKYSINQHTFGSTVTYSPFGWWQGLGTVGLDQSSNGFVTLGTKNATVGDTLGVSRHINTARALSGTFNTTLDNTFASQLHSTLTLGADVHQGHTSTLYEDGNNISSFGGGVAGENFLDQTTRDKSRGYFGQWLLGVRNTVYLTLGLRAEDSPNYGADHGLDYAPRWGLSIVRDIGTVTAKLRYTEGRSTRAPGKTEKDSVIACSDPASFNCTYYGALYGPTLQIQRGNLNLKPESQKGPEYGIDLFLGSRGSLSITRYDQSVSNLISSTFVDSVQATDGVSGYFQIPSYVNIGDIKNTGWLTDATLSLGLVTLHGTYSWTRSRITRLTPGYTGTASVGDSFNGSAEHTGSFTATYANARTTFGATLNYVGQILQPRPLNGQNFGALRVGNQYVPNYLGQSLLTPLSPSVQLQLNGSRIITRSVTAFFNIMNAGNFYRNEGTDINVPVMGRQSFVGFRLRY